MMSPITVSADVGPTVVCEGKTEAAPNPMKKFPTETVTPSEVKTFAVNITTSGAGKVDAAFQVRPEEWDEKNKPMVDLRR